MIDGSPSPARPLADVHFREIDGEFLKQQARIWLEEVLAERFDTETSLADLLEDGNILNRVSIRIGCMLPKYSDGEPLSPKSLNPDVSISSKHPHSGKYLPYSNVDSFLKVCKTLGLTAVDLFSPPDVVDKKDIRRVCLCIRALSKKAQMKNLDVPEFDSVTHHIAVTMPTEFVGGIRESLSQANAASSPGQQKETPDKVAPSPLNLKRHFGRTEFSSSECLEELERKQMFSDNGDDGDVSTTKQNDDNVISPETPSVEDEDLGFSIASRSSVLSDDEKGPSESFEEKAATSNYAGYPNENISHETMDEKSEPSQMYDVNDDDASKWKSSEMGSTSSCHGSNGGKARRGGVWLPLMASGLALLGTLLMIKSRSPPVYEIRKGDTLSEIARRTGKSGWEELVNLNPTIKNPNLIYPNEKLKLQP